MSATPKPAPQRALFTSAFERHLSQLRLALRRVLGRKQKQQAADQLRFVCGHQLGHEYFFSPYMSRATVEDVRSALEVSEALDKFVFDTSSADAEQFATLFDELCTRLGTRLVA